MGFVRARSPPTALLTIKGDTTRESVNEAFKDVKDFKTDILCKPWYYGDAPLHIPNNVDRTTTPKDGVMVQKEDCFPISDVDPAIKQVRGHRGEGPEPDRQVGAPMPSWQDFQPFIVTGLALGRGVRPVRGRAWWCSTGRPGC